MIVGTLTVILFIPGSDSLKDKRRVVRSMLDRIRGRFNASAAEIDLLDSHTTARLGFACVSNDAALVNRMLDKIRSEIESNPLCEVTDTELEIM